jgi:hypothetical protein
MPTPPKPMRLTTLLAFGVLAFTAAGCGEKNEYPPDVVQTFMTTCQGGDGARAAKICACALDKIQWKYTATEFADQEALYKAGTPGKGFVAFVYGARNECRAAR